MRLQTSGLAGTGARDKAGINRKVLVAPHIEERRTLGGANQASEFFRSDAVHGRHDASLQMSGTRCFGMSPRGEIAFPRALVQQERAELSGPE
jgi:hypothetical protein